MDPKRRSRSHPPADTPKPRAPMLDRCNAIKHVDYEAGGASSSDELSSSSGVAGDDFERRSHSLDLYSHSPSPSAIFYSSQTSFRVGGHEGELDLLCRSLGLSGPDDFAIPASVWEARKLRADFLSPTSSSTKLAADPITRPPMPDEELLEGVKTRAATKGGDDDPGKRLPPSANSNRSQRSIKSVRPPPEIATSLVSGSTLAHRPPVAVAAVSPLTTIGERRENENVNETRNPVFSPPSSPEIVTEAKISYLVQQPSSLSPPTAVQHPRRDDDVNQTTPGSSAPEDEDEDFTVEGEKSDISEEGSSSEIDESEDKVSELRVEDTGMQLQDSSARRMDRNVSMPVMLISPNASFRRTISSWIKGSLLGSGSFGTVYEAISDDGFFFAVKEVSLLDQGSNAKQCIAQLEQEIALLSRFEHENIVQYFGTDKEETKLYIFLELVTQGSLASLYQKYHLRDSQVSAYTRQILNGLDYLHDRDVVHRDIKCANILVDAKGSVKLADFGLAKQTSKLNMLKSCKGSIYWMAPEVAKAKPYGPSADIWSLGCTVLEMLTRKLPYPDLEWTQALFRIGRGERPPIPSTLSKDARDFIHQCVQVNPSERPSAAQLLKHPFVNRPLSGSLGSGQALRE